MGNFRSFAIVLIPLAIAAIACLIAYFLYLKRLNKAVSRDGASGEPRHRGIAPSDFVPWILVILLLVWNAISLSKIADQTAMLSAIYSNQQTFHYELSNQISELRSSADDLAEDQNQLARYSWQIGSVDTVAGTARLDFTIMPTEFSDNTAFSLAWGGRELKLTKRDAGSFTGSISVDFFQDINEYPVLVLEEGEVRKTQLLRDVPQGNFWSLFLPHGGGKYAVDQVEHKNNTLSLKGQMTLWLNMGQGDIQVKEARLVQEVNGEVKKSEPVSLAVYNSTVIFFNDEFNMGEKDVFRVYLEVTSDTGFTVRTCLYDYSASVTTVAQDGSVQITDRNNKVIYGQNP